MYHYNNRFNYFQIFAYVQFHTHTHTHNRSCSQLCSLSIIHKTDILEKIKSCSHAITQNRHYFRFSSRTNQWICMFVHFSVRGWQLLVNHPSRTDHLLQGFSDFFSTFSLQRWHPIMLHKEILMKNNRSFVCRHIHL